MVEQATQLTLLDYLDGLERDTLKPGCSVLVGNRFGTLVHYIDTPQGKAAVVDLEGIDGLDREETVLVPVAHLRPPSTVGDKRPSKPLVGYSDKRSGH